MRKMRSSVLDEVITTGDLVGAFPQDFEDTAAKTVQRLRRDAPSHPRGRTPVRLNDEILYLPYRIYNDTHPKWGWLPLPSSAIWNCLFSCHHDGYERERAIRRAIASGEHFVVPFVLQLLGGYPIQIHEAIEDALTASTIDDSVFANFAASNGEFMDLTLARATSYRSAYYRSIPKDEYPALRLLEHWMTNPLE
jgi:hypothetical protein